MKASSYPDFKEETKQYLIDNFNNNATILDVGAGSGTYYYLLGDYFNFIDAVEIYKPLIEEFELDKKYNNVFNKNIQDFDFEYYDVIIMGDVLEHIKTEEAQKLLNKIYDKCKELIIAVPYEYIQDIEEDNIYAKHWQDDLTDEVMITRYPKLKCLYKNERIGIYVKL